MNPLTLALATTLAFTGLARAEDIVVRIGHVGPVSGSQAHYGKDNENGARMAVADLNKQNVMIGGKHAKFELVAEDDAADPKQGTAAATKLCDQKVNGVVGHLNSGTTIPASKIYNGCGLPMITPSVTYPGLTQQGFNNVFRLPANDDALGAGVATYAAQSMKLRRVAVIDNGSPYGSGVADAFKDAAGMRGIQIVSEEHTNDKATDFMSILVSLKSKSPDAVFFGGIDTQAGPMLHQLDALGLTNIKFLGGDGVCTDMLSELAAGAKTLNNVLCVRGGIPIAEMPGGKAWKMRYDARFPGDFQVYSPYTYDATMVLVDAMKRAGSADPKVYLPYVHSSNYKGVTGTVQFTAAGDPRAAPMTFYTYRDGKAIEVASSSSGGGGCPGNTCLCGDSTCSAGCCPKKH